MGSDLLALAMRHDAGARDELASRLTSLSEDSIRRHHRDKLVRMSPGRLGMTVKAVLSIARPVV